MGVLFTLTTQHFIHQLSSGCSIRSSVTGRLNTGPLVFDPSLLHPAPTCLPTCSRGPTRSHPHLPSTLRTSSDGSSPVPQSCFFFWAALSWASRRSSVRYSYCCTSSSGRASHLSLNVGSLLSSSSLFPNSSLARCTWIRTDERGGYCAGTEYRQLVAGFIPAGRGGGPVSRRAPSACRRR
jgi:hypothetical protein